jgi:hypothetical protein
VKPGKTTAYSTTKGTKENKSANSFRNLYHSEDKSLYVLLSDFIKSSFLFGHFIETQKFAIYTAIQIVHIA